MSQLSDENSRRHEYFCQRGVKRQIHTGSRHTSGRTKWSLLKSGPTEARFHDVLTRPYLSRLISPRSLEWLKKLMASAEMITIAERITVCRDPTDDKFLELAVSGNADLIMSGDADLLVLDPFRGIPIVSAAAFVQGVPRV